MCIALICPLGHCVNCLDLNKCREAASPTPFAASYLRSFRVIILNLAVFSFDEGDLWVPLRVIVSILSHRLHLLRASRDVRNQTWRVVCRPVALVPDPIFFHTFLHCS